MRNIVIILLLAVGGGAVGWLTTMIVVQNRQNAALVRPSLTGNASQNMTSIVQFGGRASRDFAQRQDDALLGGAIGIAVGLITGIGIVKVMDNLRVRKPPA